MEMTRGTGGLMYANKVVNTYTSMSMPGPAGPECDCARIGAFEVTYSRLAGLMYSNEAMDSS